MLTEALLHFLCDDDDFFYYYCFCSYYITISVQGEDGDVMMNHWCRRRQRRRGEQDESIFDLVAKMVLKRRWCPLNKKVVYNLQYNVVIQCNVRKWVRKSY